MKSFTQACLVSFSLFAVQAFAQDEQAPTQTETQTESVNMQMAPPGAPPMNIQMNIQMQHSSSGMMPASASAPETSGRDCGTGRDPGCEMTRRGHLPMDAEEFNGFLLSLRGNDNELDREDMVKATLSSSFLTAKQLGLVLDLFANEVNRFEVAQMAAPKLVNPKHALGLSTKFQNNINQSDYTKLVAAQRD